MPLPSDTQETSQYNSKGTGDEQNYRQTVEKRFGRSVDAFYPSPERQHYRYRIQLQPNSNGLLGYHQPRSHNHEPIIRCDKAHKRINTVLPKIGSVPKGIQRVEFRTNGVHLQVHAQSKRQDRTLKNRLDEWATDCIDSLALNGQILNGMKRLPLKLGGIEHQLRPESFYQVNLPLNEILIETVLGHVQAAHPTHVLDLFSGVGNFTFPIAKSGLNVTAIESANSSFFDARDTKKRTGLAVTLKNEDLRRFEAGSVFADVIVLDPPRAGAGDLIDKLLLTRPKRLIYVSCHTQSLARDMRGLSENYNLTRLELFEFFPGTPHIETVAVFDRH